MPKLIAKEMATGLKASPTPASLLFEFSGVFLFFEEGLRPKVP